MPSLCLCMMLKNEAACVRRALASARPLIDRWVVVDTGSTDGTQDVVREALSGLPGTLHDRPWVDWGTNRSEAVALARRSGADFILLLDADERLVVPDGYVWPALDPDLVYWMTVHYGGVTYGRPNLLSVRHAWRYAGVTHEALVCDQATPRAQHLPIILETLPERATKTPERCAEDARMLEAALLKDPGNARYVFYLAQSYRDSLEPAQALATYARRTAMGGWQEEVWYAQYMMAFLGIQLGRPEADVVDACLRAYDADPRRGGEALGLLADFLRQRGRYPSALAMAGMAKTFPLPEALLFLDGSFYQWRCLDIFAVAAYWAGDYEACIATCDELLAAGRLPLGEVGRVQANRQFALDKVKGRATA